MSLPLINFIEISQLIGASSDFVQGGGGNTSAKLNNAEMAIKASGFELSQVSETTAYTTVYYPNITDLFNEAHLSESDYSIGVRRNCIETENKPVLAPSMETGFHAFLDTYVVHTHSIYANLLTCAENGQALVEALFPGSAWISYVTPGLELTEKVRDVLQEVAKKPEVFFLQNHGLIVHAQTKERVLFLHEWVNRKIKQYFQLQATLKDVVFDLNLEEMKAHVLFPDQVVYTESDTLRESKAGKETIAAYYYILNTLQNLDIPIRFIPLDKAGKINQLESEKRRKEIAEQ